MNLYVQLHMGAENSLKGKKMVGDLAGSMLMRGTTSKDRQAISDEINRLQARFGVNGSATEANGTVEATKANIGDAIALLADVLRNPSFDEKEFGQLKEERIARAEEQKTDPRAQASIDPTWACSRSSGSMDWRRILASKFMPPVVKPPALITS